MKRISAMIATFPQYSIFDVPASSPSGVYRPLKRFISPTLRFRTGTTALYGQ
jgi:hypothetical protein